MAASRSPNMRSAHEGFQSHWKRSVAAEFPVFSIVSEMRGTPLRSMLSPDRSPSRWISSDYAVRFTLTYA
jgi:hypothetical protein